MSLKIKIQYGILAGERTGGRLRKALRQAGYSITKNRDEADIIIAHSAGCFWLPDAPTQQKLMLIDPPYWPGRSVRERAKARTRSNFRFRDYGYSLRFWLARNLWGIYYAVRDFRRTRRIIRHAPAYNLERIVQNHTVLLVRNEHDDWLTPGLDELQKAHPKLKTITLPGDHEDITHNSERYVNLLQLLV